jgi:hypothetical protein
MKAEMIVIVLRQDYMLCWRMVGSTVKDLLRFDIDPQPLFAWLKNYPGIGVHLLVDIMEEEVYVDSFPMLFPWEQPSFAVRQMHKRFPKTAFCQYRYEQPKALPWESRSGHLLLSGFNDDTQLVNLFSWLDIAKTPVKSVRSLGLLLPTVFKLIWFSHRSQVASWSEAPHFLLARIDEDSFRQTLIVNGELRTVRQIQLRNQTLDGQMQQLLQEIRLLDKFVHTQKMIAYDQTPDLYYIGFDQEDSHAAWQAFKDSVYTKQAGRSAFVALSDVIPVSVAVFEPNDRLQAIAVNSDETVGSYFPPSVIESAHYAKIEKGLWFLLLLILIAFFSYAATFFAKSANFDSAMTSLQSQHNKYQTLVSQLNAQLQLPLPVEQLKLSVEFVEYLTSVKKKQASLPYLVDLSDVLSHYPNIKLSEITLSPKKDSVEAFSKLDRTDFDLLMTANIMADEHTRLRDIQNAMDAFVVDLGQKSSIAAVTIVEKPINIDSSRSLDIIAQDGGGKVQLYPFKLLLSFKVAL